MWRAGLRLMTGAVFVGLLADVALAAFFPSPFTFSFVTRDLLAIFVAPLRLVGCV